MEQPAENTLIQLRKVGEDTFVSDGEGKEYLIRGFGAGKGVLADIDSRIDLTRPIYEQVQALHELDEKSHASKQPHSA